MCDEDHTYSSALDLGPNNCIERLENDCDTSSDEGGKESSSTVHFQLFQSEKNSVDCREEIVLTSGAADCALNEDDSEQEGILQGSDSDTTGMFEVRQKHKYAQKSYLAPKERPFVCELCGSSFIHKSNLCAHKRAHKGLKPHSCELCGKRFSQKIHLRDHIRTHTGEKPFVCNLCGGRFSQGSSLNAHMRIHTGEKPYVCECGHAFDRREKLKRHHTEGKCS